MSEQSLRAVFDAIERRIEAAPGRFLGVRLPAEFDPVALLDHPAEHGVVASYERPSVGFALVGIGEARRIEVRRHEGPVAARGAARRALPTLIDADDEALRPRMLGGFRFNPDLEPRRPWEAFGAGRLVLPRILFVAEGDVRGAVLAPGAGRADLEPLLHAASAGRRPVEEVEEVTNGLAYVRAINESRWCAGVAAIASEVRAGAYEKAVLATSIELVAESEIDIGAALARLRRGYPECHLFTFRAGDGVFFGASPELLVAQHAGRVHALGLAGSMRRGDDEEEDDRLAAALLASAKDRMEHETVVRAIRERLAGATEEIRAPNVPTIRRLRNIQHLATEITGRVRHGVDVLDLVRRLHPTPAVCGWPQHIARDVIEAYEDFDRGWYAGPVGWVDAYGEGEFAVALRTALARGRRAWLFAGNGIVGDSEPQQELAEVRWKFRPLTEALGGAGIRPL